MCVASLTAEGKNHFSLPLCFYGVPTDGREQFSPDPDELGIWAFWERGIWRLDVPQNFQPRYLSRV